jgi:citrate synthase
MSKIAELNETVEFKINGQSFEFPVIVGSENEKGIDIESLRAKTLYITLDSGFKNTGSCQSGITFLDGEEGILRYRGYSIEELAEKASFLEVAYLLIHGELPSGAQLADFEQAVAAESELPAGITAILDAFPQDTHPMAMLSAVLSILTGFYPTSVNANPSAAEANQLMIQLLGKLPTLSAYLYRRGAGKPYLAPDAKLGYVANFLYMMYGEAGKPYEVSADVVEAMDKLLILHADHEQNCSTSTVRIVGSSHASLFSSVSAGVSALWGPLHGGANQQVIEMLEAIKADGGDTERYLLKAKDKNDTFRLMGFGHRVYKNFDPRATIIKKACDNVLNSMGINDPVLGIAKGLEQAALSDSYFKDRKLYPNVDFYSGIIYRALGIPTEMFTVMFALGRLPGWMAQWKEMREGGEPIGRPRQIYTGYTLRPFVAPENR